MNNDPDDMARFDNDPRSPMYNEPEQEVTMEQIGRFMEQDDIVETMVESDSFCEELRDLLQLSNNAPADLLARAAKRLILASEVYAKECIENV